MKTHYDYLLTLPRDQAAGMKVGDTIIFETPQFIFNTTVCAIEGKQLARKICLRRS